MRLGSGAGRRAGAWFRRGRYRGAQSGRAVRNRAREIKELIQDSVQKVKSGTELVNESGQTLDDIVNSVKKVNDIIAEIAAASGEQSAGIDQVNHAVTSMDEATQQNAALAEQTSAASAAMSDKAEEMTRLVSFFKVSGMPPRKASRRSLRLPRRQQARWRVSVRRLRNPGRRRNRSSRWRRNRQGCAGRDIAVRSRRR